MTADIAKQSTIQARFLRPLNVLRSAFFGALYAITIVVTALSAFFALSGAGRFGPGSTVLIVVLFANLTLIMALAVYVSIRLGRLWSMRADGLYAPRLHLRFAGLFSVAAVLPTIIVAIFFSIVYFRGIDSWFSERIATLTTNIVSVANATLNAESDEVIGQLRPMAHDLSQPDAITNLRDNPIVYRQYLKLQTKGRFFQASYVLNDGGSVLVQVSEPDVPQYAPPSPAAFEAARLGKINLEYDDKNNLLRALYKMKGYADAYLYVVRYATGGSLQTMVEAQKALAAYKEAKARRGRLTLSFALVYFETVLMVLIGAIWVGLGAANRIVWPIGRLAQAAQRVRDGDLEARVIVGHETDEVASLSRGFNEMTAQLLSQRRELVDAHQQSEDRRHFMETVLSGVGAGVLDINEDGVVSFANPSAIVLLGLNHNSANGRPLKEVSPEFEKLFIQAQRTRNGRAEGQVEIDGDTDNPDNTIFLNVKVVTSGQRASGGAVITFDDMSRAIAAQRSAAWREVARRIAHEIRNPLTPIQLSAERIRRKYRDQLQGDRSIFDKCTDTIIRQVSDIGRMIDEFSSFARMPIPKNSQVDLGALVKDAVFTQHVAFPDITFNYAMPPHTITVWCDERLSSQAIVNVIKNAAEAVSTHKQVGKSEVRISVRHNGHEGIVEIADNGPGWPVRGRERLLEPYMTTRSKGTGLGLAIVNRIMEDHGGRLELLDRSDGQGGAVIILAFPMQPEDKKNTKQKQKSSKEHERSA